MTITPEAILQIADIAVLVGIFYRMGRFGAEIEAHEGRLIKLENET